MDVQLVISAIGSVGFPIVACVGLFYLYDRTIKDLTTTLTKVNSALDGIKDTLDRLEEKIME